MSTPQNNLNFRGIHPLQFELSSAHADVYENIRRLREKAQGLFPKVSKVFRLFDEACLPNNAEDMLLEPKLMAQGMVLKSKRLVTIWPKSVIGFGFLLPTNKVAYLGLATYPFVVEKSNAQIPVPYNGNAAWSGLIETFLARCSKCENACSACIEAHELSCELLQEAENMGILGEVQDPTDYWTTRSHASLERVNDALRCGKQELA